MPESERGASVKYAGRASALLYFCGSPSSWPDDAQATGPLNVRRTARAPTGHSEYWARRRSCKAYNSGRLAAPAGELITPDDLPRQLESL